MTQQTDRLQILDLFRFCAAASVLVYHMTYRPRFLPAEDVAFFDPVGSISRFGFLGVELFFLISGFVIIWSADKRTAREFAASRIARLMPSFWVSALLTCVVLLLLHRSSPALNPTAIAANLTMTAGFLGQPYIDGVYWTLQAEIKFYVLVFVLVAIGQMPHIERWLLGWVAALVVAYSVDFIPFLRSLVIYPYGAYFAAGGLFFLSWKQGFTLTRNVALLVCCVLSCFCVYREGPAFLNDDRSMFTLGIAMTVVVLLYILFAAVCVGRMRVPSSTLWVTLGALTYPLYLLHNEIGKAIASTVAPALGPVIAVLLASAISLTLAFVLARTVERHGCPWLRKRLTALTGHPSPASDKAVA
jgi:peptidoglycan/LPS O-acetylase OafA/YrhL